MVKRIFRGIVWAFILTVLFFIAVGMGDGSISSGAKSALHYFLEGAKIVADFIVSLW